MSEEDKPKPVRGRPKKKRVPTDIQPGGAIYKPEVKGAKRFGKLDWTLDELIAYKNNGTPPARIPDADLLYKLGSIGVSLANAADLFEISQDKFCSNPDWITNWQRGRAECGSRIRASIVDDALEKDNLMAKIYIDKILGGDKQEQTMVQVNVNTNNLKEISTDDLLEVAFKNQDDNENN